MSVFTGSVQESVSPFALVFGFVRSPVRIRSFFRKRIPAVAQIHRDEDRRTRGGDSRSRRERLSARVCPECDADVAVV